MGPQQLRRWLAAARLAAAAHVAVCGGGAITVRRGTGRHIALRRQLRWCLGWLGLACGDLGSTMAHDGRLGQLCIVALARARVARRRRRIAVAGTRDRRRSRSGSGGLDCRVEFSGSVHIMARMGCSCGRRRRRRQGTGG